MLARTLGPGKLLGIDACWSETNGVQEFHMQGEQQCVAAVSHQANTLAPHVGFE